MTMKAHVCEFYNPPTFSIQYFAYDKRSSRLAVAREDNSIEVWIHTENVCYKVKEIVGDPDRSIEALVWCRGVLLSAGLTGEMTIYDLSKLRVSHQFTASSSAIWCMKETHGVGESIALGTEDGSIILMKTNKLSDQGQLLNVNFNRILVKEGKRILCLAWSKDNELLVAGSLGFAKIWHVESGSLINRLPFPGNKKDDTLVVWCCGMFLNDTVICGDSSGSLTFWDAKQGTLIQRQRRHHADVLCLAIDEEKRRVYAAGIDPFVIIYELVEANESERRWVYYNHRNLHTHDVRALIMTDHYLISGGVDCNLGLSKYPPKVRILIPHLPSTHFISPAGQSHILVTYPTYLELYELGKPVEEGQESEGNKISLSKVPQKQLQLRTKHEDVIVTSVVSPDCQYIIYATSNKTNIYHYLPNSEESSSKQRLHKIPCKFGADYIIQKLAWLGHSKTEFAAVCADQSIYVIKIDSLHPDIIMSFPSKSDNDEDGGDGLASQEPVKHLLVSDEDGGEGSASQEPVKHLLVSDEGGNLLAAGTDLGDVSIYSVERRHFLCRLPRYTYPPTALCFTGETSHHLMVSYADNKIMEFNIEKKSHSEESDVFATLMKKKEWFQLPDVVEKISSHKNLVLLQSKNQLILWDRETPATIQKCDSYKYLQFAGILDDRFLLILQKTPHQLLSNLPPTLKKNIFGT